MATTIARMMTSSISPKPGMTTSFSGHGAARPPGSRAHHATLTRRADRDSDECGSCRWNFDWKPCAGAVRPLQIGTRMRSRDIGLTARSLACAAAITNADRIAFSGQLRQTAARARMRACSMSATGLSTGRRGRASIPVSVRHLMKFVMRLPPALRRLGAPHGAPRRSFERARVGVFGSVVMHDRRTNGRPPGYTQLVWLILQLAPHVHAVQVSHAYGHMPHIMPAHGSPMKDPCDQSSEAHG